MDPGAELLVDRVRQWLQVGGDRLRVGVLGRQVLEQGWVVAAGHPRVGVLELVAVVLAGD